MGGATTKEAETELPDVVSKLESSLTPVRRFLFWVGFFYVLLAAYFPAMRSAFIYDDLPSIVENADFRQADPLPHILGDHEGALQFDRRPVGGFLTLINFRLFGLDPLAYHAVNLLLHWACAIILAELLILAARRLGFAHARVFALACASLWAIHPLNSVTVIFTYQRMEILMALFFLMALLCFYRAVDHGAGEGGWRFDRWHGLCVACALLSILSKENGAVVLFALPVLDRVLFASSWRELWSERKAFYIVLCAGWAVTMAWIFGGERVAEVAAGEELASPWNYFKLQCRVIVGYIGLFFWPDRLTFIYTPRFVTSSSQWLPQMLLLLVMVGGLVAASRRFLWVAVPGALFFLSLGPTSSIVPVPLEPQAEWRMYLPSAFLVVLCVAALARLAREFDLGHRIPAVGLVALVLVLGLRTNYRARDFRNPVAIWEDTAAKQPLSYKAWANLGYSLLQADNPALARGAASALLNNARQYGDHLSGLTGHHVAALADMGAGEFESARSHLEAAIELDAEWHGLHADLGGALVGLERYAEALAPLRRELERDPDHAGALAWLCEALAKLGQSAPAAKALARLESVRPSSAEIPRLRKLLADPGRDDTPDAKPE